MPTITFNKLSRDKKKALEVAALKEFSNHTYEDISINRIIHEIGMPRGSFYLYFENKEDLYLYVTDKYITKFIYSFINYIKENNGDIIKSYEGVLDIIIKYCKNGEKAALVTKFLEGLTHRISGKTKAINRQDIINCTTNSINKEYLSDDVDKDLFYIIDLLTNTLIHSLTEYLLMNKDEIRVKNKYFSQLNIIKKGIYKI